MTHGYVELELDLPGALLTALLKTLDATVPAPLTAENTLALPEEQGIYTLHIDGIEAPVYIGKTDGDAGLRQRLSRHYKKLAGRKNISPIDVKFKAVRLFVFTAMDLEASLIDHFGGVSKVLWSHSGFGSNDPGKERDTTRFKAEHFDTHYPVDIDFDLDWTYPTQDTVANHLQRLKEELPYLFRFERPNPNSRKSFHEDFLNTFAELSKPITPRSVIKDCLKFLPIGWKATSLPSHIICYKDDPRDIKSGEEIAVSRNENARKSDLS